MNVRTKESAEHIISNCLTLDKRLGEVSKVYVELYRKILDDLESIKDDIAEVDVYDEFEELKTHLAMIEDYFAQASGSLDEAKYKAQTMECE